MKKAVRRIASNSDHMLGFDGRGASRAGIERASLQSSRRNFMGKAAAAAAALVVAALLAYTFVVTPPAEAQVGSPAFANPPEIKRNPAQNRVRGTIEIVDGDFAVPGGQAARYRQYRGWREGGSRPAPGTRVSPGPTLRARLGDQVQIAFFNKADNNQFPYSPVSDSKPPFSDFGCDRVGKRDPVTGKYPYPASDIFPNCFHGSTTANIHYHGTHTSPDGLGDNVLVQVLADHKQPDWSATFNSIFDSGKIPQKWEDLPLEFRNAQIEAVRKHDEAVAAGAIKNDVRVPEPLLPKNMELIHAGQWPEYFIGAFPNFFDLPDFDAGKHKAGQAPGTHWYHAHKHGSTSLHIRNGLAGAFIIESSREGGYDHFIRKFYGWGDAYGDHEKIFVFQQYDPVQNLERRPRTSKGSNQVLVNGQLTPTITMKPGEVQLWRFINATQGNTAGIINAGNIKTGLFQAPQFQFVQTAQDGVQFSPANYASQPYLNGIVPNGVMPFNVGPNGLILAAGNRADLLVKAPKTVGRTAFKSGDAILFFVNVEGAAVTPEKSFPTEWAEMPKFLLDLPKPAPPKDIPNPDSPVQFQWEKDRTSPGPNPDPPKFMINGRQFGDTGTRVDQCMPLDGLQEWVLENYTTEIAHPFHIHINPFQIIQISSPVQNLTYTPSRDFIWHDVIAIPPAKIESNGAVTPGRVVIRQAYPDFAGTFVLHCHILAHEDRGMMQLVRIVPRDKYPTHCQGAVPRHH
jgi:FtsP/CotA-like multicopper oxidase with cupredoxin domain